MGPGDAGAALWKRRDSVENRLMVAQGWRESAMQVRWNVAFLTFFYKRSGLLREYNVHYDTEYSYKLLVLVETRMGAMGICTTMTSD